MMQEEGNSQRYESQLASVIPPHANMMCWWHNWLHTPGLELLRREVIAEDIIAHDGFGVPQIRITQ
eukprot:3363870-Amphidinium_carterae.1